MHCNRCWSNHTPHECLQWEQRTCIWRILLDAIPVAESTVIVSGRKGYADFINGHYVAVPQKSYVHGTTPVYQHTVPVNDPENMYPNLAGKHVYMFFHDDNRAWAVSHIAGSHEILAYVQGSQMRPHLVDGSWHVVASDGQFEVDVEVKCGMFIFSWILSILASSPSPTYQRSLHEAG